MSRSVAEPPGAPVAYTVYDPDCPSRLVLSHVTSRWGVLVLGVLSAESIRFNELRRRIGGVSEKMLAQTLRTLERDGFVGRLAHPEIPPRVEYSLTARGQEAASLVRELMVATERWAPDIVAEHGRRDSQ